MENGERIRWWHYPKGGYGYPMLVKGRFVRFLRRGYASIDVECADGQLVAARVLVKRLMREERVVAVTGTKEGA